MPTPEPFEITISDEQIADLHRRIDRTRWSDDFGNADGTYGVEEEWLRELVEHWRNRFDWRTVEAELNAYPQFRVDIDGIPIHFLHIRSSEPDATPLVLTHGWPWTIWDYRHVIGPLTDPAAHGGDPRQAFHLVIPALPGFGFSSPLRTTGVDCERTARLWDTLMREVLGYERYAAAGNDWGSLVTGNLGNIFPDHLLGVHMTLAVIPGVPPSLDPSQFTGDEAWMGERTRLALPVSTAHVMVHSSDPQTLAWGLNDSPVGLAAWIWERRRAWSDPSRWDDSSEQRDHLCATASIYWFTETIGTSMRFYKENLRNYGAGQPIAVDSTPKIPAPTAFGVAPQDIVMMPRAVAEAETNLQRWTLYDAGGHFVPYESPSEYAADVREFFGGRR